MTWGWFIFGVVMPAIVVALGWVAVVTQERWLRQQDAKRNRPAE